MTVLLPPTYARPRVVIDRYSPMSPAECANACPLSVTGFFELRPALLKLYKLDEILSVYAGLLLARVSLQL